MGSESGPSEENKGITPQETRALSDAKLKEGGARLEVTKAQVEEARAQMEYEKNPATKEFREALKGLKRTQEANTERHLQALKLEIGHPGKENFDDAYNFASSAVDYLDKKALEELVTLQVKAEIPFSESAQPPFMADDKKALDQVFAKNKQQKRELNEIVATHEKIVKLKAEA